MDWLFVWDSYLFRFIDGSGFTVILLLSILKILAKYTEWGGDDKIVNMLLGMVRSMKGNKGKEN